MKLIRFLRKCRNESVKIETKEGQRIEGTITSVDKTMNVEMSSVLVDGNTAASYTIRGSSIRYILFRDDIDFKPLLVDDRPRNEPGVKNPAKRRKTNI